MSCGVGIGKAMGFGKAIENAMGCGKAIGMVKSDGKSDGMPENDAKKDEDWDGLGNTTGYSYFYKKTRDNTTFVCRMISLCFTNCTPRGLEKETRMPYYCV